MAEDTTPPDIPPDESLLVPPGFSLYPPNDIYSLDPAFQRQPLVSPVPPPQVTPPSVFFRENPQDFRPRPRRRHVNVMSAAESFGWGVRKDRLGGASQGGWNGSSSSSGGGYQGQGQGQSQYYSDHRGGYNNNNDRGYGYGGGGGRYGTGANTEAMSNRRNFGGPSSYSSSSDYPDQQRRDRSYQDRDYNSNRDYDDYGRDNKRRRYDDNNWDSRRRPSPPAPASADGPPPDELTATLFPELIPKLPHPPRPEIAWFVGKYEDDEEWLEEGENGMLAATWVDPSEAPQQPDRSLFIDDVDTLDALLDLKTKFSQVAPAAFNLARTKSNPWERFGRQGLISRSAPKLALLDWEYGLIPSSDEIVQRARSGKEWRWVDLCGGPGGFSEFILYRLSDLYSEAIRRSNSRSAPPFRVRGFGITIKHPPNAPAHQFPDFDMKHFHSHANRMSPCFQLHYGADGTGDLLKVANVKAFAGYVMEKTESMGVDLVVADGGFEMEQGKENEVETVTFPLLLAQVLAALMTLRRDGTLVLKTFDCYLPPTVGLIHLLARLFDRVSMTKGGLSRPASPERYIVCSGLRREFEGRVVAYLSKVLQEMVEGPIVESSKSVDGGQRVEPKEDREAEGDAPPTDAPDIDSSLPTRRADPKVLVDLIPRPLLLAQQPYVDWISSKNLRFAMEQLNSCQDLWSYVEEPDKVGKTVTMEETEEMIDRLGIPRGER